MKTIVVFGASGIIGQHLRLSEPPGYIGKYYRRTRDDFHAGIELDTGLETVDHLVRNALDVGTHAVINLAGEARPDVVEKDPDAYHTINVLVPDLMASICDDLGIHFVQVSTQAVFGGDQAPYGPSDPKWPVNAYGKQKVMAELLVMSHQNWSVVRPTFVLGVRPFPHIGRANPFELLLKPTKMKQVTDRYFSPCFARDIAVALWTVALSPPRRRVYHVGTPISTSRYSIALAVRHKAGLPPELLEPVAHESFPGLAPRALDTTYKDQGLLTFVDFEREMDRNIKLLEGFMNQTLIDRARDIALFLGMPEEAALAKLQRGFGVAHQEVAADFGLAGVNPTNLEQLNDWYRNTTSYIWELSVYHADAGFNYSGMCEGIVTHLTHALKAGEAGADAELELSQPKVLVLGDGVGDLTIALDRGGFNAIYHDLEGSQTARFAHFRFLRHLGHLPESRMTSGWMPAFGEGDLDAVVALDILEHVPNVEEWVRACFAALKPGGLFMAQNAFGVGDAEHGNSIPMHLSANNVYETDWDPLLDRIGFIRLDPNGPWRQRPA